MRPNESPLDKVDFLKINLMDFENVRIITEDISDREILQIVDNNNWNGETINVFLYRPHECFDKEEVMREVHE